MIWGREEFREKRVEIGGVFNAEDVNRFQASMVDGLRLRGYGVRLLG